MTRRDWFEWVICGLVMAAIWMVGIWAVIESLEVSL